MTDAASALVGTSTVMEEVRALVRQAARNTDPLLLFGEPGTGKAMAARAVHSLSARSAAPFVAFNYAGMDNLFEYGLFGAEEGAFSGPRRPGHVEQAEGGTLLIDPVCELSLASQAKLMRLIQRQAYERVGGTATHQANVRVMATTLRSLPAMVKAGTFREDLCDYLNSAQIFLPPLRDRPGDVEVLARHFLETFGLQHGRRIAAVTPGALALLAARKWIGNVRLLEHWMERLVVIAPPGDLVIDEALVEEKAVRAPPAPAPELSALSMQERQTIEAALGKSGGNRSVAARILGVSRRTLYRKLEELGLLSQRASCADAFSAAARHSGLLNE